MLPTPAEAARIVVCEDDQPTLELLCDHLVADRFGVLAAPTAADAMRLCTFNEPDLLLLDLGLPDAAGLDLLREIRNPDRSTNRVDPALGVIIVSGRSTERDRVRGLGEGADDYVQKPFSYGELLGTNFISQRRSISQECPANGHFLVRNPPGSGSRLPLTSFISRCFWLVLARSAIRDKWLKWLNEKRRTHF